MKIFYRSVIILVLSLSFTFSLVSAQGMSTPVFFMKENSSAKISIEYTFSRDGNWTLYPTVYSVPNLKGQISSIAVKADPSFLNVTIYQSKYDITYTITPKNNTRGNFELYTGFCGHYQPIVIGLNESEVNPKTFEGFGNGDNFGCSPYEPNIRTENLAEYSTTPEFPFAIPILMISIVSLIIFYRIKIRN